MGNLSQKQIKEISQCFNCFDITHFNTKDVQKILLNGNVNDLQFSYGKYGKNGAIFCINGVTYCIYKRTSALFML